MKIKHFTDEIEKKKRQQQLLNGRKNKNCN